MPSATLGGVGLLRDDARPRLSDRVLARGHRVDGKPCVVLIDADTGRLMQIGEREWLLLAAADGTRDVEGLVRAARREGAYIEVGAARAFLAALQANGFLEEGIAEPVEPAPVIDVASR